jgi:ABC-type uncharacterized transport system substrate-binding protein
MRRRQFIALIGGAAGSRLLGPLAARAQQSALPVIGYLGSASPDIWAGRVNAFRHGLGQAGFVEGRNVAIEFRWAEGQYDRLQPLAVDLVGRGVNVIVSPGSAPAALIAKAATATIPVVFETGADPVRAGLVASLNRPGGNVTGVTALSFELGPKRLELLHELVPSAKLIAVLVNPAAGENAELQTRDLRSAARALAVDLVVLHAASDPEVASAFAAFRQSGAGGLVIVPDVFTNSRREQLAALTLSHGVPSIFQSREFVVAGGLIGYGGDIADSHRMAGALTGRVLKGEKPADLPVRQATKVELFLNLKTAAALGINVPLPLSGRADGVIE